MYWRRKHGWQGIWICLAVGAIAIAAVALSGGFETERNEFAGQPVFDGFEDTEFLNDTLEELDANLAAGDFGDYIVTDAELAEAESKYGPTTPLEVTFITGYLVVPGTFYVEARCIYASEIAFHGDETAYLNSDINTDPIHPGQTDCFQFTR
jgi:hypothetical protein